jgi:hypothetical protein
MRRFTLLAAVCVAAALAAPAALANNGSGRGDHHITVMTQNLYLGTDLRPVFTAPNPFALFAATGAAWAQVQANDFPARAQAIADEIADAKPDLVGLQEATLYRTDVPADGPASPAETVAYDFEALLVQALTDRGLSYMPASTFTGTDVELPAGLPPALDVRFTDRVVVLVRTRKHHGPRVHVSNPQSGRYAAALTCRPQSGRSRPRAAGHRWT